MLMLRRQLLAVLTLCNLAGVASSATGIKNEGLARSGAAAGASPQIDRSEEPLAQTSDGAKKDLNVEGNTPPVSSAAALQDAPQRSKRELAETGCQCITPLGSNYCDGQGNDPYYYWNWRCVGKPEESCAWGSPNFCKWVPSPPSPPSMPPPVQTGGDPITTFQGREMRYFLSTQHFTPVLDQGPIVISQLAGPANPPPGLDAHKGAWVVAMEVHVAAMDKVLIETVDPTTLLAHPNATAPPATTDALTTMRLSVGGKQLAAGEHKLSIANAAAAVSAKRVGSKRRIGSGWVEQITITADGLELRITSAKASKFADEQHQVLGLHLDVEFLTFDQSAVRGALPEMWGLQPMSEATKLLLDQKSADN